MCLPTKILRALTYAYGDNGYVGTHVKHHNLTAYQHCDGQKISSKKFPKNFQIFLKMTLGERS